jgi:hypothetical protein
MTMPKSLHRIRWVGAILLAAIVLGAMVPRPGLAASAEAQPGTARIWIYRTFDLTLATPCINGTIVAVSRSGNAFYRDVRPGTYLITADSEGSDVNQLARVSVMAGQTVYIKVDANAWWAGVCRTCQVNTFYTRLHWCPVNKRTNSIG